MRREELFAMSLKVGSRNALLAKKLQEASKQSSGCPNPYGGGCHCPPDCPILREGNCPDSD